MMKSFARSLLFAGLLVVGPLFAQSPGGPGTPESTILVIPDGTPVQLRFSQAVWGMAAGNRPRSVHAHSGDVVRMVVAEDLVVGGKRAASLGAVSAARPKG